ncbi:hypothetical protein Mapa_013603 [Marchantia paleacea]|nr:hypothetical protein Mapa_013603 [Marchantia paleacea]
MFQNCLKVVSLITILLLLSTESAHCQNNASAQDQALMAFRDSNAANSTSVQNWLAGSDKCKPAPWRGLKCWSNGFVKWIQLPNANLSGNISRSLRELTSLTRLDLRGNLLEGQIPDYLGTLVRLKKLLLSGNKLVGSIPATLVNMTLLEELGLGDNNLQGIIPSEIFARLTHLRTVDISNNQLTGPLPETLTNMTSLVTLLLGGNKLNGPLPSSLASSTSLRTLDLSGNSFTGALPLDWTASNLTSLILSGNQLQDQIPPSLLNLSSLASLTLADNNFTGTIPALASCQFGEFAFQGNPNLIVEPCPAASNIFLLPSPAPRSKELATESPASIVKLGPGPAPVKPAGPSTGPSSPFSTRSSSSPNSENAPRSRFILILVVAAANIGMIIVVAGLISIFYVVCKKRQQVEPHSCDVHDSGCPPQLNRTSNFTYSIGRTPPDSARTSDFKASSFSESPSCEFEKSSVFQSGDFRIEQPDLYLFQLESPHR